MDSVTASPIQYINRLRWKFCVQIQEGLSLGIPIYHIDNLGFEIGKIQILSQIFSIEN